MFIKKLELMTVDTTAQQISKAERYEIIAMVAQKYNEAKDIQATMDGTLWDSSDIDFNFEQHVGRIN